MFELSAFAVTHRGAAKEVNEDCVYVFGWRDYSLDGVPAALKAGSARPNLVLVADGLGGHAAGDRASRAVVEVFAQSSRSLRDLAAIKACLADSTLQLQQIVENSPKAHGLATTLAGLHIEGTSCTAFNVGDSAIFRRQRGGYFTRISGDDSPPTQGARSQVVTQTIDATDTEPDPHVHRFDLAHGDVLLLCSDGLTDFVDRAEVERIFGEVRSGEQFVLDLLRTSLDAQSPDPGANWHDNISIVLVIVNEMAAKESAGADHNAVIHPKKRRWFRRWSRPHDD